MGGPEMAPQTPPTLVAPRLSRGAPRFPTLVAPRLSRGAPRFPTLVAPRLSRGAPRFPDARRAPAKPWRASISRSGCPGGAVAPLDHPTLGAGERLDRGDPVGGARMGREEAAAAAATRRAHQPAERVGHVLPAAVPRALQELDPVLVGGVFLGARVLAQEELAGDRRQVAAAGDDLVEDDHADVQARAERLRLLHVVEVLVRQLVRENGAQLVVVGLLQQARGDEELAVPGAGRVDGGVVHHADLHLAG